jgi:lysyl-tRNA synthetase class 2
MNDAWKPTASLHTLQQRALFLRKIREFFFAKQIMEVETPNLDEFGVTDPHLDSIAIVGGGYLQTSPEYAMKRLLAAGFGPIYQMSKVYRAYERGVRHNPEFTMLEWYQVGYDHFKLMAEVEALLQTLADLPAAIYTTYQQLFQQTLECCPFKSSVSDLQNVAQAHGINAVNIGVDKDTWLELLFSHCIEPHLGKSNPQFVYDYPASQAALARLNPDNPLCASRFELYINGLEIANGFYELTDADLQLQRFEENNLQRLALGEPLMGIDHYLIAALKSGLPDCAGVALGVDRLFMAITGAKSIAEVISFSSSVSG